MKDNKNNFWMNPPAIASSKKIPLKTFLWIGSNPKIFFPNVYWIKRSIDTKDVHIKEIVNNFLKFKRLLINKISIIKYKIKNLSKKIDLMIFSSATIEILIIDEIIVKIKNIVRNYFILFSWKVSLFSLINTIPAIIKARIFKLIIKLPAIKEIGIKDKRKLVKFSKFNNLFNWNIFY